mmetsp:Transcript_35406/g.83332  ORF Transcript_35406/g.83332 Transcript_35406/m.83332 type:complete len:301 (-) Transcript_35406:140-1042(-)
MAAVEESEAVKNRNELIAGTNAGFVCKLVEYPLDTIKVQAQTQSAGGPAVSPIALLRKTLAEEGFFALYRGIPSPLLGSMVENSVLFSSYAFAGRFLNDDPEQLPFAQKLLCGSFSGLCVATVLTPVELIKCRMQTVNTASVKYANSWQCLLATLKEGGVRSLFYGHTGTLAREVPGNAAWFGGYELGCILMTPEGGSRKDIHPTGLAAAGALGGMSYWGLPFPMDVVKSKIQTGTHNLPPGVKVSVPSVFNHVLKTEGVRGLYRGCGITVARAAPSNAVLFVVYEMSMRLLKGQKLLGS